MGDLYFDRKDVREAIITSMTEFSNSTGPGLRVTGSGFERIKFSREDYAKSADDFLRDATFKERPKPPRAAESAMAAHPHHQGPSATRAEDARRYVVNTQLNMLEEKEYAATKSGIPSSEIEKRTIARIEDKLFQFDKDHTETRNHSFDIDTPEGYKKRAQAMVERVNDRKDGSVDRMEEFNEYAAIRESAIKELQAEKSRKVTPNAQLEEAVNGLRNAVKEAEQLKTSPSGPAPSRQNTGPSRF